MIPQNKRGTCKHVPLSSSFITSEDHDDQSEKDQHGECSYQYAAQERHFSILLI